MSFEEPIEPVPGSKTEHPPQLRLGDATALEFFESQGFEGAAREVDAEGAPVTGRLIGNLPGEFYALSPYSVRIVILPSPILRPPHPPWVAVARED